MKKYLHIVYRGMIVLGIVSIFLPHILLAATLTFDAGDTTVGTTGSFLVSFNITADNPINALSLTMTVPHGLEVLDISDGNSIVNIWLDEPTYASSTHTVNFSGIIPGGFSGDDGRLILVRMRALKPGSYILNYDLSSSLAYLNTPNAIKDALTVEPLTLIAESGKENLENIIPDTTPPEDFAVSLLHNTTTYGGKWVAVFATQDKGSGVSHYEAAEYWKNLSDPTNLSWKIVTSPYVLADQSRSQYVYIKAVDTDGNARIEVVSPLHPRSWLEVYLRYILIGVILVILLGWLFIFGRKKLKIVKREKIS